MIHRKRRFLVTHVESAEELAEMLSEQTWTLCTAFEHRGLLFLNDSFSEDGAQEYAAVRAGEQIESITFSWCSPERALDLIQELLNGGGEAPVPLSLRLESGKHSCRLCA